jgi:hypothetical protein
MADKEKSAELIMKLYELRREEVMRQARNWYFTFHPESAEDITAVARGEHSAYYRMVTSYWDMACSFVNHGAIDEQMFNDANGEQNFVFAKIEPFIAQLREMSNNPGYLAHLEKLVMRQPEAQTRLAHLREMTKRMMAARAEAAEAEATVANA